MDTPASVTPSWLRLVARLFVCAMAAGVVFSGAIKALDPASFQSAVRSHGLVSSPLVVPAAWAFTAVEGLGGMAALYWVLVDRRAPWGARVLAALFAVIAVYAGALVVQPPPKPTSCGCGLSTLPVDSWAPILVRSAAASAALLAVSFLLRPRVAGSGEAAGEPMPAPAAGV